MSDFTVATEDLISLKREVTAFLERTPGAVRVCEGGGPENLAASFAVTLHKVLHEKAIRNAECDGKAVKLVPSSVPFHYNVFHKPNAKMIGVISPAEVGGDYMFFPTNAGYWDQDTMREITWFLMNTNRITRLKSDAP